MQSAHPRYACVHTYFEAQAARRPDAIALVHEERSLSYGELNRRANQLAHELQGRGVGPDMLVGICAERSPELVIGLLGILKAGGAYLPIDPNFPPDRIQFILGDSEVGLLLCQDRFRALLPAEHSAVISLDTIWEQIAGQPEHNPDIPVTAEHSAYVNYTSGSTGRPKGSIIPHRSVTGYMFDVDYLTFDETQVWLHYSSISWDALTLELWTPLLHGGVVVIYPHQLPTPHELAQVIQAYNVNILWLTVSLFNAVIDAVPEALAGVRQLVVGGEALQVPQIRRALELLPHIHMINGYGPSECTVFTCCYPIPHTLPEHLPSIPIGRPIGDRRVYLLDAHLNRTPIGVPGELYVGGPAVARGYLSRPALTAEKFIPDPFSKAPGARMYRSGDLARYRRDGLIEFVGRIDHQVKVRGFRIEPEEIEAALQQHPAVQIAIVVAHEHRPGEKRLVAYVVGEPGGGEPRTKNQEPGDGEGNKGTKGQGSQAAHGNKHQESGDTADISEFSVLGSSELSSSTLRQFLQPLLPEYMIPSAFIVLDKLPLTATGKIDRRALPKPEQIRPELEHDFTAPRTPIEELLAGLWADVLGLDRVGIHDDFFALGGQSLIAARLIARVREVCEVELPVRALFEQPTIAELARQIEQTKQAADHMLLPPLEPAARDRPLPLSFAQQRLWFLDRLQPNSPLYNVATAVRLHGPIDADALRQSLNAVAQRHESLRTTFAQRTDDADGQPQQIIGATAAIPLIEIDLRAQQPDATFAEREAEARRQAVAATRQPFDLERGPLLRANVYTLSDDDHVLLLTMHHIISDGWSMGVLIRELAASYVALTGGIADDLAPLAVQYADYALWQRSWLEGDILSRQLDYWQQQLSNAAPLLRLPTDRPRPAAQSYRGATHSFTLPATLSHELVALSRREGATLFMTLLASFKLLLHWYSDQDDIVVGSPIAGRSRVELEELIGFFVNTLVLRSDLSRPATFAALLRQVRETTLGAYAHQDVPFDKLVEVLQPDRNLSHMPIFQVWFVLQNMPMPTIELPNLALHPLEIDYGMARYDLRLGLSEGIDQISGSFEYNTDLFDAATIEHLATLFETLLAAIVARPESPLDELKALLKQAHEQHHSAQQQALRETSMQKLKQARRQSVRGS